jgi:hypothetical protein
MPAEACAVAEAIATSLVLDGPPSGRVIGSTRRFVQEICGGLLGDEEVSSRVALATHELLENVAKYSSGGPIGLDVELRERSGQSMIRIRTSNRARPDKLAELRRVLETVTDSADPFATYLDFIAKSSELEEGSGLGLARIRAEADMNLHYTVEGDLVTLVAETPAPPRIEP